MNDVFGPVLLPLAGAAVGLMIRRWPVAQRWFCFSVMVLTLLAALGLWQRVASAGMPRVLALGNWSAPFGIVLVADPLGAFMTVMSALVMTAGMGYALGCRDKCVRAPTFYPLFLTLAAGLHGGILTGDLFNLFVFTELVVISGAALTALSDDENGVEA
ncbi:MAG: Na+/H+ antiporter subunit D, partial [Verrucomicrobiae bacterium]|nr:Na+/H+ antiporter subunit D [Verrucomicrobiae bacterium]